MGKVGGHSLLRLGGMTGPEPEPPEGADGGEEGPEWEEPPPAALSAGEADLALGASAVEMTALTYCSEGGAGWGAAWESEGEAAPEMEGGVHRLPATRLE